ncbi:MAG: peptidylprolyl isomerase [Bryobacteraceae bacterium]|jgi:peptidyl-prolyl cis-trans isomerase A (cyclophilin A)
MRSIGLLFLTTLTVTLAGCGGSTPSLPPTPVPDSYRVKFETSRGAFVVEVTKAWAPEGAERFYRLVEKQFYDDQRFFRVVRNFVVQFGINGDPVVEARWRNLTMRDDPVKQSNTRGTITFAKAGPDTRTTQVFINLKDNTRLDAAGFAPFGQVVEGMEATVDHLWDSYGDAPPRGYGPDQNLVETMGNAYLDTKFPHLDTMRRARIVTPGH